MYREGWVKGFLTGANVWLLPNDRNAARSLTESTDLDGVFAWIDNYCAAHPLVDLVSATTGLIQELSAKWLAAHPRGK
jgi:hypothetical protein